MSAALPLPGLRWMARWRNTRMRCDCMGYWFPHRIGGGACEHSRNRHYHEMLRAGMTQSEAMAELSAADLERMFPLPAAAPVEKVHDDIPF